MSETTAEPPAMPAARRKTVDEVPSIDSVLLPSNELDARVLGHVWLMTLQQEPGCRAMNPLKGFLCELAESDGTLYMGVRRSWLVGIYPHSVALARSAHGQWFFICPGENCQKRVRMLFQQGPVFRCRFCANLTYEGNLKHGNPGFELNRLERLAARLKEALPNLSDPDELTFAREKLSRVRGRIQALKRKAKRAPEA